MVSRWMLYTALRRNKTFAGPFAPFQELSHSLQDFSLLSHGFGESMG
jgi:hypothetical protein